MSQNEARQEVLRIKLTLERLPATASASVLSVWQYKLRRAQAYL